MLLHLICGYKVYFVQVHYYIIVHSRGLHYWVCGYSTQEALIAKFFWHCQGIAIAKALPW